MILTALTHNLKALMNALTGTPTPSRRELMSQPQTAIARVKGLIVALRQTLQEA